MTQQALPLERQRLLLSRGGELNPTARRAMAQRYYAGETLNGGKPSAGADAFGPQLLGFSVKTGAQPMDAS
jgi:hypothetical protein